MLPEALASLVGEQQLGLERGQPVGEHGREQRQIEMHQLRTQEPEPRAWVTGAKDLLTIN